MTQMRRDDRDDWPAGVPAGTFSIDDGTAEGYPGSTAHILFVCPNGRRCSVLLGPTHVPRPKKGALCVWGWNGDKGLPTITPSIDCVTHDEDGKKAGGCGWHGHITNGEMV